MDITVLFESFMVFYLLEVMILTAFAIVYYKQEQQQETLAEDLKSAGPTASQVMAMYKVKKELERQQQ